MEWLRNSTLPSILEARYSFSHLSVLSYGLSMRKPLLICYSIRKHHKQKDLRCRGVFCCSIRRHHRRRDMGYGSRPKELFRNVGDPADEGRDMVSGEDIVVLTLDLQNVKQRAEALTESARSAIHASAVHAVRLGRDMVNDGRMLLNDLRSSVSVQKDRRVIITLRRSSINFAFSALLWSALLIIAWKILSKAAKKYGWGWEESFGSRSVFKRDRSLGGREVLVSRNSASSHRGRQGRESSERTRRKLNPLDAVEISRSERDMIRQTGSSKALRNVDSQLPEWWPSPASLPVSSSHAGDKAAKEKASSLLMVIIEKRLAGKDFEADDILQLYQLCKYSGSSVAFDSVYVRDSFYRAAVNMVLSSCGRSGNLGVEMGGEKAAEFLAGLAYSIHLDAERASIIVNAAVAARTRATFLQAWALCVQGKGLEAEEVLAQLSCILTALPPTNNSPEMEMVAQGLGKHLSFDERSRLFEMFLRAGGGGLTERVATEALGLRSAGKWP